MLIFNQAFVGAHYFRTNSNNYLIGARTGVHQDLLNLKLDIVEDQLPDTIFLSDLSTKERVSCMDLEFIFLASLFMGMDFPNGKTTSRLFDFKEKKIIRKLRVVLEKGQEEVVWGQLEPSLLGASRGFLKNKCRLNKNLWEILISEANFFNLKDINGEQFTIEDFVELHYWDDDGRIILDDGVLVKKEDIFGNFTVVFEGFDDVLVPHVDFSDEDIHPVWDVPQSLKPFSFSDSSIIPLGTSSPFSLDAPPTSYWLKLGERESYMIDCGFFSDIVLERNGGSINNLKGIILTHCHGDHFNPIPFLYRTKPIELWTTIENYKLAQRITCSKAGITPEEFQKRFIFKQVEAMYPGKKPVKYPFGFLDIEFHYSIHPIPTIGLTIYKEDEKLVVFSSDMVDLDFMESTLLANKIIEQDRYDMFMERFKQEGYEKTLFLLDCGGDGFIHGKAGGYSKFFHDTTKVVECHRGARKPGEEVLMQLAQPLNLYKISDYNLDVRITSLLAQYLNHNGVSYFVDAVSYLKESVEVVEYAADQPIVLEGAGVKDQVYLIDYGRVVSSGGLSFEAGNSFGEESLIDISEYRWSYRSHSPVRLIILRSDLLKRTLEEKNIAELKRKYQWRQALACARLFVDLELPVKLIDELQLKLKVKKFGSDEVIYHKGQEDDGHLYLIHSGKLLVEIGKGQQVIVGKNDIVGEAVASGFGDRRNATVKTQGQVELIRMERETFLTLMTNMRILSRIKEINQERAA